jgi:hypothetical protein
MVLYTPHDVNIVMQDLTEAAAALKEVTLANGITLLGQDVEGGFRIERVLSGNTNAYLLREYQPGTVIKLT